MTGFKHNVIGGLQHFLARLGGDIDADLKEALAAIHPSVVAVENAIKAHGPEIIQAVTAAMAAAALDVVSGGTGTVADIASAAGKAAIAAGETAAASGGKALASDVLHAIATAQVSAAQSVAVTSATATPAP